MDYYISKQTTLGFDEAIEKVTEELKKEGFGVITTIDVKNTLKQKLDVDFRPYTILGACNPQYAHKAISLDDKIGTLLPCNFMVQQRDQGAEISAMDPKVAMSQMVGPEFDEIIRTIAEKVRRVVASL